MLINKDLTITGPGASNLTISGDNLSRVFKVANGKRVTTQFALRGLTISNGVGVAAGSSKSMDGLGGGILVEAGAALTVNNSTLSGNSAAYKGGGIYINIFGTVTVKNFSHITGNTAPVGSGVDIDNQGLLYQDMSIIIGILDGNAAKPI